MRLRSTLVQRLNTVPYPCGLSKEERIVTLVPFLSNTLLYCFAVFSLLVLSHFSSFPLTQSYFSKLFYSVLLYSAFGRE